MPASDVLVVGGGLLGLCTAWSLREGGARVSVFDAGRAGAAASWAGGGILWPIYPWRYPPCVQLLALAGAARYPDLCQNLTAVSGVDCELRRSGVLILDVSERAAALRWAGENNTCAIIHDEASLAATAPGLRASQAVGLPGVRQVRNPRLCKALVRALRARGVGMREHCRVRSLRMAGGRVQGIQTDTGNVAGAAVVIAAGSWSTAIAPADALAPVRPVKGQMLLLRGRPGLLATIIVRDGHYLIPRADGHILVGSTVEHAGFDTTPTAAARKRLQSFAISLLPALAGLPVVAHWAGLRPATDDGLPRTGPVPAVPGLYVNTGHYRNGVVCAPAAGALLAEQVLRG